jgi:hypothetical protein
VSRLYDKNNKSNNISDPSEISSVWIRLKGKIFPKKLNEPKYVNSTNIADYIHRKKDLHKTAFRAMALRLFLCTVFLDPTEDI